MYDDLFGATGRGSSMDGREFREVGARTNNVEKTHEESGIKSR